MVKHRSSTRWPENREVGWRCVWYALCIRSWGAWVSWFSLQTKVDGFFRFCLKTDGYGSCALASNHLLRFPGLGIKIGSCSLVIWPTKSLWQFLGLCHKTKWAVVCRLYHKIDERMMMVQDTRWDQQVRLGFSSLASRLVEAQRGWCTWHHRGGHVQMKPKMDGSMWRAALDSSTLTLPFSLY
jgi:hypothetical protein